MFDRKDREGKESRWEQLGYSLAFFGIFGFLIVGVVMRWLLDAPTWALWAGAVIVAALSFALGFTDVDDEEDSAGEAEDPNVKHVWRYDRPDGFKSWVGRLVSAYFVAGGMSLVVNRLILDDLLHASVWVQLVSATALIVLAIAIEFLDLIEVDVDAVSETTAPQTSA
jgi:hypothetical protein